MLGARGSGLHYMACPNPPVSGPMWAGGVQLGGRLPPGQLTIACFTQDLQLHNTGLVVYVWAIIHASCVVTGDVSTKRTRL
jgi:hypothetical protein